jgi:SAM-dependent methyltransferase
MSPAEGALPFEHLHRYTFASELVRGKRVLDLAAREGYGARILAGTAESVIAMDADETAAQNATTEHKLDNLKFVSGRALSAPPGENVFDAIVCFDAIEHVMNPARIIDDIKRALAPGGLLILSAPHEAFEDRLFPVKAFKADDFFQLVKAHFASVRQFAQTAHSASVIERFDGGADKAPETCPPQYLIALASDGIIPSAERTTMPHPWLPLLGDKEKTIRALLDTKTYLTETTQNQKKQISDHKRTIASLEEAFAWHKSQIAALNKSREYLDHEVSELRKSIVSDREGLEWRASQAQEMEAAIAEKDRALDWRRAQVEEMEQKIAALEAIKADLENRLIDVSRKLAQATEELALIHASTGWKLVLRMRSIRSRLLPDGTMRYRLCKRILKMFTGG